MSLRKQMIIFITGIVMTLLLGTYILNVQSTRTFIEDQLYVHAKDTAETIGIAVSEIRSPEDVERNQTLFSTLFDPGYYQFVKIKAPDGTLIWEQTNPAKFEGVPQWFINLIPIETPVVSRAVQNGWFPVSNSVEVQINSGLAYNKLWQSSLDLLYWFILAALIAISIAFYIIYLMLKPLQKIEVQAEEIIKKQYYIQEDVPITTEFRSVVSAMNGMVSKLKSIFERDAAMLEKLHRIAYQDKVTEISNRHHFDMVFPSVLDKENEASFGAVVLIRVDNLKHFNDTCGYLQGDKMIRNLSSAMQTQLNYNNTLQARLNGSELISVIPKKNAAKLHQAVENLCALMPSIIEELGAAPEDASISIAYCNYQVGMLPREVMSNLDFAMRSAEKLGANKFFYLDNQKDNDFDNNQWNQIIDKAIAENRFTLFKQSSMDCEQHEFGCELFVRMIDEAGNIQNAGSFMPMVARLDREIDIDRIVIEKACHMVECAQRTGFIAINLSTKSFFNQEFRDWSIARIAQLGDAAQHIALEFPESFVASHIGECSGIIHQYQQHGIKVGLDQFGTRLGNIQYICDLKPDYIKIDGSFSHAIIDDAVTIDYVHKLSELAHDLNITLIAMSVEEESQKAAFTECNIAICQGSLIEAPTAVKEI